MESLHWIVTSGGKPHEENLCFFRCLALHNGCHTKNLERDTKYYYQQYKEAYQVRRFHGVKLAELDKLEKRFEVNIQVYSLAPTQTHGSNEEDDEETPDIATTLIRRSHRHYSSTLYLSSTSTKTTSPISKTWPGIVNLSVVRAAASTGSEPII